MSSFTKADIEEIRVMVRALRASMSALERGSTSEPTEDCKSWFTETEQKLNDLEIKLEPLDVQVRARFEAQPTTVWDQTSVLLGQVKAHISRVATASVVARMNFGVPSLQKPAWDTFKRMKVLDSKDVKDNAARIIKDTKGEDHLMLLDLLYEIGHLLKDLSNAMAYYAGPSLDEVSKM